MPAPRKPITNLEGLRARHLLGEHLTTLAAEAKPSAVNSRTLKAAFARTPAAKAKTPAEVVKKGGKK